MSVATNALKVIQHQSTTGTDQADCLAWLAELPSHSVDMAIFSPPYEDARDYGIGFCLRDQQWVDWMVEVIRQTNRVVLGSIFCVCEGRTRKYRWSATPALLMADLHRAGFNLRKPAIYKRSGIPGSGGRDGLRNCYEFIIWITRPGILPWSDNTALGTPPKRRTCIMPARQRDGRKMYRRYTVPRLANPGNVIEADSIPSNHVSPLAYQNEAWFPEQLTDFFVQSYCSPGGIVLDCFCGSGTTAASAVKYHRRFIGCDIRQSQVELTRRRIGATTPSLFQETA